MEEIRIAIDTFLTSGMYAPALGALALSLVCALVILPVVDGVIRFVTRKTVTDIDDKVRVVLRKPIFYSVMLIGAQTAVALAPIASSWQQTASTVLYSLLVLVIAQALVRTSREIIYGLIEVPQIGSINEQTAPLFQNVVFGVVVAAAAYAVFLIWGIDVTAWLASAGIVGIAVGFAAKDTLANLIAGIFVLADKPYSIGDYIVLGNGTMGIVETIGLRSTRIRTFDDEEVTVPNSIIANDALINKSTGPESGRVKVAVGVAYGTNMREVEKLLLAIAREHEKVLADPEPSVRFLNFGESSLDVMLSCRVRDPLDVAQTESELRFVINERFAENGISIPFPQRDVHLIK